MFLNPYCLPTISYYLATRFEGALWAYPEGMPRQVEPANCGKTIFGDFVSSRRFGDIGCVVSFFDTADTDKNLCYLIAFDSQHAVRSTS